MPPALLFYGNAIFGAGHYQRMTSIIRAVHQQDPAQRIIILYSELYGGLDWPPFQEMDFCEKIRLPCLLQHNPGDKTPTLNDLTALYKTDVTRQRRHLRQEVIRQALKDTRCTAVVLEAFPFLMKYLTEEVEGMLLLVRAYCPEAIVFTSLREVVDAAPFFGLEKMAFAETFARDHLKRIFVHADPNLVRLEESYGDTSPFRDKVEYTGFVVRPRPGEAESRHHAPGPVVCSVGGGRDGQGVVRLFVEAWSRIRARKGLPADVSGYVFTGLAMPDEEARELRQDCRADLDATDLPLSFQPWERYDALAPAASCSVSMCGYNTCYELLAWGVPCVFVPRFQSIEVRADRDEQRGRADKLVQQGWARFARDAEELADQIIATFHAQPRLHPDLDFDGAATTARRILECLAQHSSGFTENEKRRTEK